MIVFIGDVHAEWATFNQVLNRRNKDGDLYIPEDAIVIQLGDLGWMLDGRKDPGLVRPIMFVDGNHDHHGYLHGIKVPTEVFPGATYIPRGTILELDGRKIGFLGGAHSVDKLIRLSNGWHWDPRENITEEQIQPLLAEQVDLLVTHTPPLEYMRHKFGVNRRPPPGWVFDEQSESMVQRVWDHQGRPPLYCGHMHNSDVWETVQVFRIMEAGAI